jgi:hypothetical protein
LPSSAYAALGDLDQALQWLEYEPHHVWQPWWMMRQAPLELRRRRRFQPLVHQMHLDSLVVTDVIAAQGAGKEPDPLARHFPNAYDGLMGVRFLMSAIESSTEGGKWAAGGGWCGVITPMWDSVTRRA